MDNHKKRSDIRITVEEKTVVDIDCKSQTPEKEKI